MWNHLTSYGKIRAFALLLLLLLFFVLPAHGSPMTTEETQKFMTVRMELWDALNQEWNQQASELQKASEELKRLKRPSEQLLKQLSEAKVQLQKSQEELKLAKEDLTIASKEVGELKTSCQTLRQSMDKERRVHRRQLWQNRLWCLLFGAGVGYAASR